MLHQHFYMGLSKDSMQTLDDASRGAFLHLLASEARSMLDKISGKTSCTSNHNKLLKKEKESSPEQEEKVLIAKSQPLQSQDLAVNLKPSIHQNPPREEEIQPFGNSLNFRFHNRPSSEYNSNSLKKGSLKKRPSSHVEH
jgi:hypothetical protein